MLEYSEKKEERMGMKKKEERKGMKKKTERMGMKKKDITLSSLAKSMGIMTIMVTDTEEDKLTE